MSTPSSILRRLRGNDAAIARIGTLDESLLRDPRSTRVVLLHATMQAYDGAAYGAVNWRRYDGGWTAPKVLTQYGELCETHPELLPLSLDAGLITHLPAFMEFLAARLTSDYWQAREEFKTHLGTREVYRGVVLDERLRETTAREGLRSPFLDRQHPDIAQAYETVLSTYCDELSEKHFHGENDQSPFISVTSHPDLAIAVGRHFGRSRNGKLHLFKLKIPEIDLISWTDHGIRTPPVIQPRLDGSTIPLHISVDGKESNYKWDERAESYVFLKIDAAEIVDITTPQVRVSSWNGRETKENHFRL